MGLKKQIPVANGDYRFVINRGFEPCLSLYTLDEWKRVTVGIDKLNIFIKKNRDFVRHFYRGVTDLTLDGANRLLLPKSLLEYAGIQKDIVLFAYINRIEIWDKDKYNNRLDDEPEGYSTLAEEVMGDKETGESYEIS